ncbi:Holliday junction resolvase RecU [Aerococcus urinaehominis]|uniref:Holliday junction resolvase RecU n=1 Tax=Aerococcus urinaehominis TaxID=128944 RepID=A0A0X8FM78_9LACT|nr:Holliday junction resolvase RecU [Aerococcus urinaehominis]AMB99807.1 Holliday junction resolvase RecU [Aerococcus urinaehominis]SDM60139.1 recombination protein U [Aerococcus urinaehominis]
MRYPDGSSYQPAGHSLTNQPISNQQGTASFAKRGMKLEEMINKSNQWYLNRKLAVIHKKPTPIQIVKVDYPKRSRAVIREAYYRQASTTDYNGIYQGYYLDFEAKQTNQKTRFPLHNIHSHQLRHMGQCEDQGGITFTIIYFASLGQAYLYPYQDLFRDWQASQADGAKSISLAKIKDCGYEIPRRISPHLDYLAAVDQLIADRQAGR